jgi:hypothetical protein
LRSLVVNAMWFDAGLCAIPWERTNTRCIAQTQWPCCSSLGIE